MSIEQRGGNGYFYIAEGLKGRLAHFLKLDHIVEIASDITQLARYECAKNTGELCDLEPVAEDDPPNRMVVGFVCRPTEQCLQLCKQASDLAEIQVRQAAEHRVKEVAPYN